MAFNSDNENQNAEQADESKVERPAAAPGPRPISPEEQKLRFGLWWVEHKATLRIVLTLTAFSAGGALLLYGLYGLADYYLISYSRNQRIFAPRSVSLDWDYIRQKSTPGNLQVDSVKVLLAGDNYDLITRVSNPNPDWYVAKLNYHFTFGSAQTSGKTSYILPGQSTYLVQLNQKRSGGLSSELVIESVEWKKQANFDALSSQLLNFEVSAVDYIPAGPIEAARQPINQVKFKIKNNSPQNFWNVDLIILLYGADQIRAVNIYTLDSLDSLEDRQVTINWPGSLPAVNKVAVIPQIDILNPASYKGFGDVISEEK